MRRAAPTIFPGKPLDWQDLENKVCQIFLEIGPTATRRKSIKTVRGRVDVDVVVRDKTRRPHVLILCECKFWNREGIPNRRPRIMKVLRTGRWFRIPVRALDSSSRTRAALKANVKPVTWQQFRAERYERWLDAVRPRLTLMADALL